MSRCGRDFHVLFLLDMSGSMDDNFRGSALPTEQHVEEFVSTTVENLGLDPSIQVALPNIPRASTISAYGFNTNVKTLETPTTSWYDFSRDLKAKYDPKGGTLLEKGLEKAYEVFTSEYSWPKEYGNRVIVLLADGRLARSDHRQLFTPGTAPLARRPGGIIEKIHEAGIVVISVGFADAEKDVLDAVASQPSASFSFLHATLRDASEAILDLNGRVYEFCDAMAP